MRLSLIAAALVGVADAFSFPASSIRCASRTDSLTLRASASSPGEAVVTRRGLLANIGIASAAAAASCVPSKVSAEEVNISCCSHRFIAVDSHASQTSTHSASASRVGADYQPACDEAHLSPPTIVYRPVLFNRGSRLLLLLLLRRSTGRMQCSSSRRVVSPSDPNPLTYGDGQEMETRKRDLLAPCWQGHFSIHSSLHNPIILDGSTIPRTRKFIRQRFLCMMIMIHLPSPCLSMPIDATRYNLDIRDDKTREK
jgi:hypothetical protein